MESPGRQRTSHNCQRSFGDSNHVRELRTGTVMVTQGHEGRTVKLKVSPGESIIVEGMHIRVQAENDEKDASGAFDYLGAVDFSTF